MSLVRILGVDPGTRVAGYGVIDLDPAPKRMIYVECGVLELSAPTIEGRLEELRSDLADVVREFRPRAGGLEHAHVGKGPHAGLRLAEARGVAMGVLSAASVEVEQYQPSHVKRVVTASGKASKEQLRVCLMRMLGLASEPKLDASDGLGLAVCRALHWRG